MKKRNGRNKGHRKRKERGKKKRKGERIKRRKQINKFREKRMKTKIKTDYFKFPLFVRWRLLTLPEFCLHNVSFLILLVTDSLML